jgi:hypothetical protein
MNQESTEEWNNDGLRLENSISDLSLDKPTTRGRLRVLDNRVLKRIFRPKRDEITRRWRRPNSEEFYALYSSQNIIRTIRSRKLNWTGHVARMGKRRSSYTVLVGKRQGRRPLERPRRR